MNTRLLSILSFAGMLLLSCQKSVEQEPVITGTVKFSITNTVKGVPMALNTGNYTNSFGEQYTITKFKYYISNISFTAPGVGYSVYNYYLVDEGNPASRSFTMEVPVGTYSAFNFLSGVDSTRNVSGAQTGALDPLNDMFWTWNSGYIMAKMEGNSPQSTVVNNKVEYHIGGFSGPNSVLHYDGFILTPLSRLEVRAGKTSEIMMEADMDDWWQGYFNLKIAENPAVTVPGALAQNISMNYSAMFRITGIINH